MLSLKLGLAKLLSGMDWELLNWRAAMLLGWKKPWVELDPLPEYFFINWKKTIEWSKWKSEWCSSKIVNVQYISPEEKHGCVDPYILGARIRSSLYSRFPFHVTLISDYVLPSVALLFSSIFFSSSALPVISVFRSSLPAVINFFFFFFVCFCNFLSFVKCICIEWSLCIFFIRFFLVHSHYLMVCINSFYFFLSFLSIYA